MARKSRNANAPSPISRDHEDKWRARDALSTLTRAEEIKRDKPLMKAVTREAKLAQAALGRVTGSKRGAK